MLGHPLGKSVFTIDVIIRSRNHQEPRSMLPPLKMKVAIIKYGFICKQSIILNYFHGLQWHLVGNN